MRKRASKSFIALFALLFLLLSLSTEMAEKIRTTAFSFFAPVWRTLHGKKENIGIEEELQNLRLKNQLLATENHRLRLLNEADWEGLDAQIELQIAQVIFRAPASWNSSLWINLGQEQNEKAGRVLIAKNSPVLYGRSVVGVVDYVGRRQSRVRLITDSGLTPSVRVMRLQGTQAYLLAKGEIHGGSKPLWRAPGELLRGIGFNYDFDDEAGPARDLRSGKPVRQTVEFPTMPLIQANDLLLTTGMDGVFPAGLEVAVVTRVHPLKEGDYYYEIEAKPTAGQLDRLAFVFVMPPVGYDAEDQPDF